MKRILVTGGTGTLGREVVAQLLDAGHEVRAVSRRAWPAGGLAPVPSMAVDLRGGEGLDAAVAGVDAIIHCPTSGAVFGGYRRGGHLARAGGRLGHLRGVLCRAGVPRHPSGELPASRCNRPDHRAEFGVAFPLVLLVLAWRTGKTARFE